MFIASQALGKIALCQEIDAPATTTILVAGQGAFTLTGEPVAFQTQEAAAERSFSLTGELATFQGQLAAALGSFTLAGEPATFETLMVSSGGSFALTGGAVAFQPQLPATAGLFAETGIAATFETFMASTEWVLTQGALGSVAIGAPALGQADENRGTFPLTFNYTLTGVASVDLDTEAAGCGIFTLTGGPYTFLSYDLLGGGGTIVAGTFSRGRWRALQDELAAEREARRAALAAERKRRRALAQARAAAARARAQAARARADQANAAAAGARALADALGVAAHRQRAQDLVRHTAALHALACAAQADARAEAQDEDDDAVALLLAA
jgi:hypothetical protein